MKPVKHGEGHFQQTPFAVEVVNASGFAGTGRIYEVCPSIQAGGIAGDNTSHYNLMTKLVEVPFAVEIRKCYGDEVRVCEVCPTVGALGVGPAYKENYDLLVKTVPEEAAKIMAKTKKDTARTRVNVFGEAVSERPDFASVDGRIGTDWRCPACGYEWSGRKRPDPAAKRTLFDAPGKMVAEFRCPKCRKEWSGGASGRRGGAGARGKVMTAPVEKPPYRVPSMGEIARIPWCGLTAVSTFSGCGGSCLGHRMAGFRVLWANEFVPAAQDAYRANHASHLDTRDIRDVKPEEILKKINLKKGELDLFDGSPPCQAFSTAGRREKGWGTDKKYEHGAEQRNEDMFFEYVRLLRGLMPRAFVAENVSGLVKGAAKGYFKLILAALKESGYEVGVKVLDAQWLGVPQSRQRAIFVGVRTDLAAAGLKPAFPMPFPWNYSVREALPWILKTSDDKFIARKKDDEVKMRDANVPANTITVTLPGRGRGLDESAPSSIKVIHDTRGKGGANGINSYSAGDITNRPSPAITVGVNSLNSSHFQVLEMGEEIEPESLLRGKIGKTWDRLKIGEKDKKHFSFLKPPLDAPCPTVTTPPGGSVMANSVCHPVERRKFTLLELRRICAFPDSFVLPGTYAQGWARLGNAVPPLMMFKISEVIRDRILLPWKAMEKKARAAKK